MAHYITYFSMLLAIGLGLAGCVDHIDASPESENAWNLEESPPTSGGCVTAGGHDRATVWGTTDDGAQCAELTLLSGPPSQTDIDVSQLELDDWWHITDASIADSCQPENGDQSTAVAELSGVIDIADGYHFDIDISIAVDDDTRLRWSDSIEPQGSC